MKPRKAHVATLSEGSQSVNVHWSDKAASDKGHDHMLQLSKFLDGDPVA